MNKKELKARAIKELSRPYFLVTSKDDYDVTKIECATFSESSIGEIVRDYKEVMPFLSFKFNKNLSLEARFQQYIDGTITRSFLLNCIVVFNTHFERDYTIKDLEKYFIFN
jgi:hypothetical protein